MGGFTPGKMRLGEKRKEITYRHRRNIKELGGGKTGK